MIGDCVYLVDTIYLFIYLNPQKNESNYELSNKT